MSNIKTEAIILKGFKYGDSSKIITLFSSDTGKFTAIVKGVRNSKSKLSGVFETMNHVSVIFNKRDNRDLQLISNAECITSYPGIKDDFEKLLTAYKLLDLTSRMMYEYDKSEEIFILLNNILNVLNAAHYNFDVLYLMYQIKFAVIQGINPAQNIESRNFHDGNFVLSDKDSLTSKNLFSGNEIYEAIKVLENEDPYQYENVNIETKILDRLQNAYEFHFMVNEGKYGYSRNRQIIDELSKKL